jgi:DNA-binding NarL/FixJ family response regulator
MAEPGMAPSTKHIVSIYTLLPMTRILLADDSIVVRQVIADFLRTEPGIEVVAESGTFTETIALAAKLNPQVILLDVHMADERVVTAERLKSALAGSCVIAMSIWKDEETRTLSKKMGAVTLLDRAALMTGLISAIKQYCTDQSPTL